jgi:Tfp pilus assembly PilM family ATPase
VPNELLGLDLGASGVKVVRLRRSTSGVVLVGADILPPLDAAVPVLALPPKLLTNYAAVAFSNSRQAVRLANVAAVGDALGGKLQEVIKVEPDQRLAFTVLRTIAEKRETQVLTVAVPEADVRQVLALFAHGAPAVLSLEHAGLVALTTFYHGPGREPGDEAVCLIEAGARTTFIAFLNKGAPVLVRTLELGGDQLVAALQAQWGLDRETALGTLGQGGTIDISQPLHDLAAPFLRQLSISRDFVERQESCRVARIFLSGGLGQVRQWAQEIQSTLGTPTVVWDPFGSLAAATVPDALHNQRGRFAAAIGAALAAFEEP